MISVSQLHLGRNYTYAFSVVLRTGAAFLLKSCPPSKQTFETHTC